MPKHIFKWQSNSEATGIPETGYETQDSIENLSKGIYT